MNSTARKLIEAAVNQRVSKESKFLRNLCETVAWEKGDDINYLPTDMKRAAKAGNIDEVIALRPPRGGEAILIAYCKGDIVGACWGAETDWYDDCEEFIDDLRSQGYDIPGTIAGGPRYPTNR